MITFQVPTLPIKTRALRLKALYSAHRLVSTYARLVVQIDVYLQREAAQYRHWFECGDSMEMNACIHDMSKAALVRYWLTGDSDYLAWQVKAGKVITDCHKLLTINEPPTVKPVVIKPVVVKKEKSTMKHIVSFSGGLGSAEALKQTIDKYGKENTIALFADVKGSGLTHNWSFPTIDNLLHERFGGESRDLYRFIWQLSEFLDTPIERLEDGRTIFRVFADNKAFRVWSGGVFVHKCSEQLKRHMIREWIFKSGLKPGGYSMVLGFDWDEEHRLKKAQAYWQRELGWNIEVTAPLTLDSCDTTRWINEAGITVSQSYSDLFQHDNCNGGCVAAGQAHFANLYHKRREVYLYWAYMEASIQRVIGRNVTILTYTRNGIKYPISLFDFIAFIEAGDYVKEDWGDCGCFVGQGSLYDLLPNSKPVLVERALAPVVNPMMVLTGDYVRESMSRVGEMG